MSEKYSLHESIGYRLTLTARITERAFEARLAPLGLTRVIWCVLLAVGQERLRHPSDIAEFIGIDRTATSRALRQMDERGLIARKGGAQDRRMTEVSLTQAGAELLTKSTDQARENHAHFASRLSDAEAADLRRLLDKLVEGEARAVTKL